MTKILTAVADLKYYQLKSKRLKESGKNKEVITLWLSAVKNIKDPVVFKELALAYSALGMYDNSITYWFKFLNIAKTDDDKKVAYQGLGNDYFMLGNPKVSNYYLNKTFLIGGAIDPDFLDDEVVEYFTSEVESNDDYKIAWPPERVDYTDVIKDAKDIYLSGNEELARTLFSKIPENSPFYKIACTELAVMDFIAGDKKKGIELSHKALKVDNNDVFALCNLSTMYFDDGDMENSKFYYEKVKKVATDDPDDLYKIAMCACEQKEHDVVLSFAEKIQTHRPYDVNVIFIRAVALYNLGKLSASRDLMYEALSLRGRDTVLEYYLKIIDSAIDMGRDGVKNDMKYFFQLPMTEVEVQRNILKKMIDYSPAQIDKSLKDKETTFAIDWAINYGDTESQKFAVYILATSKFKWAEKMLLDMLINSNLTDYLKKLILTVLIINGSTKKIGMVVGNVYQKTKLAKLSAETPVTYLYAYAGLTSVLAPAGVDDMAKYRDATEFISKILPEEYVEKLQGPELSVLIVLSTRDKITTDYEVLTKFLGIEEKRLKKLKKDLDDFIKDKKD